MLTSSWISSEKNSVVHVPFHKKLLVYLGSSFIMLYNILTVALAITPVGFATICYHFMTASRQDAAPNQTDGCFH